MAKLLTALKNKYSIPTLFLLTLVVGLSAGMMAIGGTGYSSSDNPNLPMRHPSFTMTFTLDNGQSVMVGNRHVDSEQTRRLEYTSPNNWVETVLTSPDIVTRWGTFSAVGSYQKVDGNTYTEYDAVDGALHTETITRGHRVAGIYVMPMPIHGINNDDSFIQSYSRVRTSARVCFNDSCTDNAEGISFAHNGVPYIYVDDARGIPLKFGDDFQVNEVTIHSEHQAIP